MIGRHHGGDPGRGEDRPPCPPSGPARGAFTVVELLIASAVAFGLLGLAWGLLAWYARAYGRHDEDLEKSRRIQTIIETFRRDVDRCVGPPGLDQIPAAGLAAVGFTGSDRDLLTRIRIGTNILNAFHSHTDGHPYLSRRYPYAEVWGIDTDAAGHEILKRDDRACRYTRESPPGHIWNPAEQVYVQPYGADFVHVPDPPGQPQSEYVALMVGSGERRDPVLWAYHRAGKSRFAPGTLVRWSESTGAVILTEGELETLEFVLETDWAFWDKDPPARPIPWVLPAKSLFHLELAFPERPGRPPTPAIGDSVRIIVSPATS